jgi:hypothetical protein
MYVFDAPGTVWTPSEYTEYDAGNSFTKVAHLASMPLLVGQEALATDPRRSAHVVQQKAAPQCQHPGPELLQLRCYPYHFLYLHGLTAALPCTCIASALISDSPRLYPVTLLIYDSLLSSDSAYL